MSDRDLPDREVREFRIRIVHFGLQAQWLTMLVLGASTILARSAGENVHPGVELILGASLTVLVSVLPWRRVVGTRWELPVLIAWSIGLLIVITMAINAAGGGTSTIFVIYGLTVVLSAALFSLTMQTVMLVVTYAFYVGVLWRHDFNIDSQDLVLRMGFLAVLMFLAGHLSWELIRQKEAHLAANSELARRAELLSGRCPCRSRDDPPIA